MHILVAPNAFKHSLDADQAAQAICEGLLASTLPCTVRAFPVADGGDGTGKLIIQHLNGRLIPLEVEDPLGRRIESRYGLINRGKQAVIEMADASGIRLLRADELNPRQASSTGTGQLIRAALDQGVDEIIIGLGGSATVDGGAGILYALGIRFFDASGNELRPIPEDLQSLARADLSGLDPRVFRTKITVLCDVENKLLGPEGAAAVFGPQKGASAADIPVLEAGLLKISNSAEDLTGKRMEDLRHGGAAGGAGAGLAAFLDAKLVRGAEFFMELTGFGEALQASQLLITGEGSLDEQTAQGKAPQAVAALAKKQNIPVIGLAGKVPLEGSPVLNEWFDVIMAIGHGPSDIREAIRDTRSNLIRSGTMIGNFLALNYQK